jgi:hypothetical protein
MKVEKVKDDPKYIMRLTSSADFDDKGDVVLPVEMKLTRNEILELYNWMYSTFQFLVAR